MHDVQHTISVGDVPTADRAVLRSADQRRARVGEQQSGDWFVVGGQGPNFAAVRELPLTDDFVRAGGVDARAVRSEGDATHYSGILVEQHRLLAVGDVPDADGLVGGRGDELRVVGFPGPSPYGVVMAY